MSIKPPETIFRGTEPAEIQPYNSVGPEKHSMGASLYDYVASKIPPDIRNGRYSRVVIQTTYTRLPPARVSGNEKRDKLFNWQRPTTTPIDSTAIQLNCFPGKDYVQHYIAIVATYYFLERRPLTIFHGLPSENECVEAFLCSNLAQMGPVDIVVVGYVQPLGSNHLWEGYSPQGKDLFAWQKPRRTDGVSVSFLGCMVSFWGDIAGHLVRALQILNNVKCVLYVGKTGALSPESQPNQWLATGDCSFVEGSLVKWQNVLQPSLRHSARVHNGTHVTVSTPICETKAWLNEWQPRCSWVDCEVGHMAQVSNEGGTAFAYLHIVSDNVAVQHLHNLANERLDEVISNREYLFRDVRLILQSFLDSWPNCAPQKGVDS